MPTYEYACEKCGGFTAVKPLAQFRDPQPCPQCAALSPRVTLTVPAFKGLFSGGAGSAAALQSCFHSGNCGCR